MKNQTIAIVVTALAILCTGCAQFHLNNIPQIGQLPPLPPSTHPRNVAYTLKENVDQFGASEPQFQEALLESGYFATIYPTHRDDMLSIDATMDYHAPSIPQMLPWWVLTGATLYIVPSWYTERLTLTARVTSPSKLTHSYTYSDGVRRCEGLVFVPFMFTHPYADFSSLHDVAKNMFKCLLLDIQKEGLLTEQNGTPPSKPSDAQSPKSADAHSASPETVTDKVNGNEAANTVSRLRQLKTLHDEGILTDEEYEQRRAVLVNQL